MRTTITILAAAMLLTACGSKEAGNAASDEGGASAASEPVPANLTLDPSNVAVPVALPSPSPVATLPAGYVGRWGMTVNDCVPGRSDAKGLMIVSADGLGFYESRAAIRGIQQLDPATLSLSLHFTGEGQEWDRTETLSLQDAGRTLLRGEQKPAGSFQYQRCPEGKETNR